MKKILSFFLGFYAISGYGQEFKNLDPKTIASPNAASLGIYGEVPVNYSTGLTNISIPLVELKEDNLSVPLILKYYSGGIKPNIYPSWVGLNWTLLEGGAITRNVRMEPDETGSSGVNTIKAGYFYNNYLLNQDEWYNYPTNAVEILKDAAPDEFSFNFNGISGNFYLDHLGNWQVKSNHEVKVICTSLNIKSINYDYLYDDGEYYEPFHEGNMFYQFILVTEDGTQYVFGGNRKSIEFTRPECFNFQLIPIATTWNLTKIISPEGNETFTFEYERNQTDLVLFAFDARSIGTVNYGGLSQSVGNSREYNSKLIEPSYLKSITSKNQKIVFNSELSTALGINPGLGIPLNTGYRDTYDDIKERTHTDGFYNIEDVNVGRKLTSIQFYYNTPNGQELFKTFEFDYFENTAERLKLKSIEEVAVGLANHPKYNFEYYTPSPTYSLPDYSTREIDHWGFYNGTTPVLPTSLDVQSEIDNYYDSRSASDNPDIYLIDMLKKITYPTKGTTTFVYEPNYYSEFIRRVPIISNSNIVGLEKLECVQRSTKIQTGGLRIQRIISSPNSNDPEITKEFYYVKDYQFNDTPVTIANKLSSGQLQTEILEDYDQECLEEEELCNSAEVECENQCLQLYHVGTPEYDLCVSGCACDFNCYYKGISPYYKSGTYMNDGDPVGWFKIFTVNPVLPLTDNEGTHIIYGEVVEKLQNGSNGYTKYNYNIQNNADDQYFDELPIGYLNNGFYSELSSKLLERNSLNSLQMYDVNGVLVRESKYYYNSKQLQKNRKIRSRSYNNSSYVFGLETGEILGYNFETGTANYIYLYNSYLEKRLKHSI